MHHRDQCMQIMQYLYCDVMQSRIHEEQTSLALQLALLVSEPDFSEGLVPRRRPFQLEPARMRMAQAEVKWRWQPKSNQRYM